MARPRKGEHDKRTAQLPPLRVTELERAEIETKAHKLGLSVSDYMRQCVYDGRVATPAPSTAVSDDLLFELNRIGVNINQIARQLNRGRPHDADFLDTVLKQLSAVLENEARRGS